VTQSTDHSSLVTDLLNAALGPEGRAALDTRASALELSRSITKGDRPPAGSLQSLGSGTSLVEAVARTAHDVPVELLERPLADGYSEHELFDLIVTSAVAAGVARREIAMDAIEQWERMSTNGGGSGP
jgi:hypothetical protein